MKAFDAYVIDKMNHFPLLILHSPEADTWVRIDGLIGFSDLMKEYQQIATAQ
jgi:protein SCO1/2